MLEIEPMAMWCVLGTLLMRYTLGSGCPKICDTSTLVPGYKDYLHHGHPGINSYCFKNVATMNKKPQEAEAGLLSLRPVWVT